MMTFDPFQTHSKKLRILGICGLITTLTLSVLHSTGAQATTPIGALALALLPGCKPGFAGENCAPVQGWNAHRNVSDARIDRIVQACDLTLRANSGSSLSWLTTDAELGITQTCRDELMSVLPFASSWPKTSAGKLGLNNVLNSFILTLMVPSVASNEEQIPSILGEEELGCDIYEMDVLERRASSELPSDFVLRSGNYPVNRKLFRYMVERTGHYFLEPARLDQIAWESEGNITFTGHFSRVSILPPVSTLVHESRHLDHGSDDGAPHVVCKAPEMEGARSCDADITGANGLEIQFLDGLLRASQLYKVEMANGKFKHLLSEDNQRLLLLEMCSTVKYKFNHSPNRLRQQFDLIESCLTDVWQSPENSRALLQQIYGPRIKL